VPSEFCTQLTEENSRVYRSRSGVFKRGTIHWPAAEYVLAWGTQIFAGPHMRIWDAAGNYGVDLEIFFRDHRAVKELPDHYFKVVTVRAVQIAEEVVLLTNIAGRLEMAAAVPAGAYIVQNPTGELYAMPAEDFGCRYELIV
jgi:hypothetical protein